MTGARAPFQAARRRPIVSPPESTWSYALDASTQISAFVKLKLTKCGSQGAIALLRRLAPPLAPEPKGWGGARPIGAIKRLRPTSARKFASPAGAAWLRHANLRRSLFWDCFFNGAAVWRNAFLPGRLALDQTTGPSPPDFFIVLYNKRGVGVQPFDETQKPKATKECQFCVAPGL